MRKTALRRKSLKRRSLSVCKQLRTQPAQAFWDWLMDVAPLRTIVRPSRARGCLNSTKDFKKSRWWESHRSEIRYRCLRMKSLTMKTKMKRILEISRPRLSVKAHLAANLRNFWAYEGLRTAKGRSDYFRALCLRRLLTSTCLSYLIGSHNNSRTFSTWILRVRI